MKMTNLQELLNEFAYDPENSDLNFKLASYYHSIGQTASAVSYYIRTAERTNDKRLIYSCLLAASQCFDSQGCRSVSVKGLIQSAIAVDPIRPEGYFLLSKFHEKKEEYQDSYLISSIGEKVSDNTLEPLYVNVGYPGSYGLTFQKAVSSWWCGLCDESCDLFYYLKENCEMDEPHTNSVNENIERLFKDRKINCNHPPTPFNKKKNSLLRHKFPEFETIENNHSQVFQDIFVLSMLNGKKNGTFLEIGGGDPYYGNNTALLEKFGWTGVSIDNDETDVKAYQEQRPKTKILHKDALTINYKELLKNEFDGNQIDYLQIDIDPCDVTFQALELIPFDEYKFAVITYEHDFYIDSTKSYKEKSRELLKSKGYVLVVDDVSPDGKSSFEDWWVHPDLVNPNILSKMSLITSRAKNMEEYIYGGNQYETNSNTNIKIIDSFNINTKSQSTSWIVDNFYESPGEVRRFALEQEYVEGGFGRGFIGRRTEKQFLFPGLKERFEKIMGRRITEWESHGMNGRFQVAWSGEPLVYHCDSQKWGGMLYLTPDAPYQCGTTLYAHKKTRARTYYDQGWDSSWKDVPGDPHLDGTPFEPVDVLGNVYNRLVIFDASAIHSASEYFGTVMENARLWQMFFFDTE